MPMYHQQSPSRISDTLQAVANIGQSISDRWFKEQRRARRWSAVWLGLVAFNVGLFMAIYLASNWDTLWTARGPHAALVRIEGAIGAKEAASAENVTKALRAAFDNGNTKAVLLAIDSPGGSPVQAELITAEIRRQREKHPNTPVIAVISDIGASAAYYVAATADQIYASRASLVGSIGVRIDSFGFEAAMRELGVERRLLTAGANKGILDPFSPLPGDQRAYIQGVLDELHEQFIGVVKEGRGERLKGGDELFTGLFWSGEKAKEEGLVDTIGDTRTALNTLSLNHAVDYTPSALAQVVAQAFGTAFTGVISELRGSGWTWH